MVQWVLSSQHFLCSHHKAWSDQSCGASADTHHTIIILALLGPYFCHIIMLESKRHCSHLLVNFKWTLRLWNPTTTASKTITSCSHCCVGGWPWWKCGVMSLPDIMLLRWAEIRLSMTSYWVIYYVSCSLNHLAKVSRSTFPEPCDKISDPGWTLAPEARPSSALWLNNATAV